MTSHLPSESLQQLTPILGSLARMIANGSQLSESELQTLLLGVDLDHDPMALKELMLWGRLLRSLHEQPGYELRHVTAEALMLRNLPEASVLLAIDTVTSEKGPLASTVTPGQTSTLSISASSLDFGLLASGQVAVQTFEVQGGPGQIIAESDQLQVTPTRFGSGSTRVRVEVKPLNGGLLWTTLKLMTRGETLEVPVLAQWADSPQDLDTTPTGAWTTEPSIPTMTPTAQTADSSQDLINMIDQAMHTTPSTTKSRPQNSSAPRSNQSSNQDILLDQINRLL
jgi:hypothetical protein